MFKQIKQNANSSFYRIQKTSEPRFKRLTQINSSEHVSNTTKLHQITNAFDNSKESLYFESQLVKVRSTCKLDETAIVGKYLGTIRKDYDEMAKETAQQFATLKLRRKDIDFVKSRNKAMEQQREEVERLIIKHQTEMVDMREKFEDAYMQTKTLDNIIVRMKKDQIFYKQFGRLKEEEMRRKAKEHKFLDEKFIHQEEKLQKLQKVMKQCKKIYDSNRQMRANKFQDFQSRIECVRQRDNFIQERKTRTYELQSIQLNDTLDEKNIHMRQITLAHKVADTLLQNKVTSLIQSYAHIQQAFHLVKEKTAISEPQLLTSKFFSYQQTAQSLLDSISQHQKRIEQLAARKIALSAQYQGLLNENYAIADYKESSTIYNSDQYHQKELHIKKINQNRLLAYEIWQWIDRKLLALRSDIPLKGLSIQDKFKELCLIISQKVKKYQSVDWKASKSLLPGLKKKRGKETHDESSFAKDASELNDSNMIQEQYMRSTRQSIIKKGFNIKYYKRQSNNISIK